MSTDLKKKDESLRLDENYRDFLNGIKERMRTAQISAARAANVEMVKFYWQLGIDLIEKQSAFKWGEHFLEQFSHDMRQNFPEMQGFSKRNLEYMRRFALLYPKIEFAKQAVSQLPWGHIVRLMQMIDSEQVREWYASQTIKNGWSRSVLEMQVESGLYARQSVNANKISNFHEHLPPKQSDLANEMLKDPYNFDFLTIQGKANERAVENALVAHVRDFLLELGQGFAFVGSQVPLTIDDQEFFIDLLFYHIKLHCYVVIELKATKFKPEHTGQLGFYLAAVDDMLRGEGDNKTIGILLCKSKSKIIADYALQSSKAPIGISEYALLKSLPAELETKLPTIAQIEAELNEAIEMRAQEAVE